MTAAEDDQLTPAGLASAALEELHGADLDRASAHLALARAQVYATLALAGEQRTANLLAVTLGRIDSSLLGDLASVERIQTIFERLDLQ